MSTGFDYKPSWGTTFSTSVSSRVQVLNSPSSEPWPFFASTSAVGVISYARPRLLVEHTCSYCGTWRNRAALTNCPNCGAAA